MRVDLEEIYDIMKRRKRINSVPLEDIEFYENGIKLDINPEIVNDFKFIGLNNIDFITTEFYKTGWEKVEIPNGQT